MTGVSCHPSCQLESLERFLFAQLAIRKHDFGPFRLLTVLLPLTPGLLWCQASGIPILILQYILDINTDTEENHTLHINPC